MTRKKTRTKKPRGVTGSTRVTFAKSGPSSEFQEVSLGRSKEEVEAEVVRGFLTVVAKKESSWSGVQASQNPQDDYDFTLESNGVAKGQLELMEIAPVGPGGHAALPNSYKPYELADWTLNKLLEKSLRYEGSTNDGLTLLLYMTDQKLFPSETFVNALRVMTTETNHCFQGIYLFKPSIPEGICWRIYPAEDLIPDEFGLDQIKENVVHNLTPGP